MDLARLSKALFFEGEDMLSVLIISLSLVIIPKKNLFTQIINKNLVFIFKLLLNGNSQVRQLLENRKKRIIFLKLQDLMSCKKILTMLSMKFTFIERSLLKFFYF